MGNNDDDRNHVTVHIEGDASGNLNVAGRDVIHNNSQHTTHKTDSSIHIEGGIHGNNIGVGQNINITTVTNAPDLTALFSAIRTQLDALSASGAMAAKPEDIQDAKVVVEEIEQQAKQNVPVEEGWLATRIRNIARMGPAILDIVTTGLLLGPVAVVPAVMRNIARKAREDNNLAPVG